MPICVVKPLPQDDTSGMAEGSAYWGMSLALFQFFFIMASTLCFPTESTPVGMKLCHVGCSYAIASQELIMIEMSFSEAFRVCLKCFFSGYLPNGKVLHTEVVLACSCLASIRRDLPI